MTYISRKTRLLVPHFMDECDPGYLYYLNRKRSEGRLKRHSSCDDLRAWVDNENLNYQYFLELMSDVEDRPLLGLMGRFIPVEAVLDILCGKASKGEGNSEEWGKGEGRIAGLRPKPVGTDFFDSGMSEATDDLLRLTDAAMTKLEAIHCIVCSSSCDEASRQCDGSTASKERNTVSQECTYQSPTSVTNNNNTEEYMAEYSNTLMKIHRLRQRLDSMQKRRDELNAKIQSTCQTKCQSSSGMTVTELYNREEHSNAKRLQKKIEKLIAERGQVLQEMCSSLKYLNELKKNIDEEKKNNKCPCVCRKIMDKFDCSWKLTTEQSEDSANDIRQENLRDSKTSSSRTSFQNQESYRESKIRQNCAQYAMNETMIVNGGSSRGSSETTFISLETLPFCDSQKTYNVVKESIPDRKFKSETTMTEVEQTLRSYEKRLNELACLEIEIEELKKGAVMAEYFKKRWLRSVMRGKGQKTEEHKMRREMEELRNENSGLKKMIEALASESEKEHNEMKRLRCKAIKIVGMQEEIMKLKEEITGYQLSCERQNECIGRLENTIREQRDEIDRLMTHMTRLCRMTEKLREVRRSNKKNIPRSRSYGPDRQNSASGNQKSLASAAPEEEMQHASCCSCHRNNCNTEELNRPRSECGRRMPDRCCESLPHQQTCRNQYRYN